MPANAASLYWDGASSGPDADGGLGTWSTAASPANWDSAATAGSDVPWTDGSEAVFGGTGDVVTVSGTVSASSLTFDSPSYRLTGGQVTLTGSPVIAIGGNDVTLETVIAGSGAISKTGTGTLTLAGNNSFTGVFTVSSGTVKAGSGTAFGSSSTGTTVFSGATVDINGKSLGNERLTISGSGVGGAGAIVNYGADSTQAIQYLTLAGPATVGGSARWDIISGGSFTMGGHTLTKVGTNELVLNTPVTSPGQFDIKEGSLWVMTSSNLGGNTTTVVTVRTGAMLCVGPAPITTSRPWTIAFEPGSTWRAAGAARWSGAATVAGATTFDSPADATMVHHYRVSGDGSVTKTGPGNWTFTSFSTYTGGTTVNAGTLVLATSSATGQGALLGTVTVNQAGILSLQGTGTLGTLAGARVETLNITGGLVDNVSTGSNGAPVTNLTGGRLRSNGGATNCYTLASDAVVNGFPAAASSVISGRLHLGAGNTGDTTVFNIADGDAVEDLRIDAAITGAGAANGITKRGAGVLALHGPALFSGNTVVEAGTLLLDGGGSLADSPVTVAAGARFGAMVAGQSVARLTARDGSSLILPALTEGATVVKGALDLAGGMIAICPVIAADTPAGTYDLLIADEITGSGTPFLDLGGAFGPTRATGSLVVNGNKLQLILTGAGGDLVWNNATAAGAADGTWDFTRQNFSDGAVNEVFRAFDSVTFDDAVAPGSAKHVVLDTTLAPARVTVDNSNGDYTFGATGGLAGMGSLVKTGSGRLTLEGPLSYAMAGPITAGGGVLDFTGKSIFASSLLLTSGGSLNNATVTTGPVELQSGSSNAVLLGSAPWTKTTAGTVTLTANSKLTGPGTVAAGHLVVGDTATPSAICPLGTGPVAISSGAALTLSRGSTSVTDVPNAVSGSGSLNLHGSNNGSNGLSTFNLSQDNVAFTGPVNVSDARLSVLRGEQIGSGPVSLSGCAALSVNGTTLPNAIAFATTGPWGGSTSANLFLTNASLTGPVTLLGGTSTSVFSPSVSMPDGGAHSIISGPIGESGGPASLHVSSHSSGDALTLSGASTYTGATTVAGITTLNLTGSLGASAVSVTSLSTLAGNGVIGNGGSLTFSNNAVLKLAMSGGAITVNGDLNLGPRTTVAVEVTADAVLNGPIPVLHYTGTLTGGASQLVMDYLPKYRKAEFAFTPGLITLDIGARTLFWNGASGDYWDPETTDKPWATTSGGAPAERFFTGDSVVFDDSGPGGLIHGLYSVRPSSITVNNTTKSYGIGSVITGPCALVKQGAGGMSVSGINSYTGGTTAHGGRLEVTSFCPLGTGPVFIAAAATLAGDGTIPGPVTLAGNLDPGLTGQSWPSTLSTGPTIFSGNYLCQLDSSWSDKLAVTGDLDITGSTLTLNKTFPYSSPDTYTIVTYTGTLTGSFTSVSGMPPGYLLKNDPAGKRIIVTRITYSDWTASFPGLDDPTHDADPDGDGLPNLVEYVIGGNPLSSDSGIRPSQTFSGNNLVFRYKRNVASRSTTTQTVQWSPDMKTWTDIPISLNSLPPVIVNSNGNLPDDITVTIPRVPGSMFVRLKVAQP